MIRVPGRKAHSANQQGIRENLIPQIGQDEALHLAPGENAVHREDRAPRRGQDYIGPDENRVAPK